MAPKYLQVRVRMIGWPALHMMEGPFQEAIPSAIMIDHILCITDPQTYACRGANASIDLCGGERLHVEDTRLELLDRLQQIEQIEQCELVELVKVLIQGLR